MYTKKQIALFSIVFLLLAVQCHEKDISPSPESVKMESLVRIYNDSSHINPSFVIHTFAEEATAINEPLNSQKLLLLLSNTYYHANHIDSAIMLNQQVIDYCQCTEKSEEIILLEGDAYNNRGIFLQQANLRDSAIICYQKAYELLNSISEKQLLPSVCINLADCYFGNGEYTQTGFYYKRASFIADSLGMGDRHNPSVYSGLAQLYQELGNYDQAEEYFLKAEKYWDSKTEYEKYFFANTRGNFFYNTEDYQQALSWFRKANASAEILAQSFALAITEANMGEIFLLMGECDSATYHLNNAKEFLGPYYNQPSFKFYIDGLYASLALLENDLPEAEKLLLQPYDTAAVNPQYIYLHTKRMQNLYEKKQDYRNAYSYQNKAIAYNDSLRHIRVKNSINEIDFRYRQDTTLLKKDLQILQSEHKASQWKKATAFSVTAFFLFVLLLAGFILYRRRIRELKHQRQLTMITTLRMEIIRNRLSPHFVFNVLNAILPSLDKHPDLEHSFRLLIRLLRNNLNASGQIAITLNEEINIVKDYLELQAFRNPQNIAVHWHIGGDIPLDTLIPSMSIQIPIENVVKYAFNDTMPNPVVDIRITSCKDNLYISVKDNGIGYTPGYFSNDGRGTGNGIKMLYKTINLLNSLNEKEITLRIKNLSDTASGEQGTEVSLVVPVKYEYTI